MNVKFHLKEKKRTEADLLHDERLLKRNQTLVDVVYGLIIFQLFLLIPYPSKEQILEQKIAEVFLGDGARLLTVFVGIILVIIYWSQSNTQFGYLKRVNKVLSAISILQLFILMVYLGFVNMDMEGGGDLFVLLGESICLAFAGFLGIFFWKYAGINLLHHQSLNEDQSKSIYFGFFVEPVTALFTIPIALLNVKWYPFAWLAVIPLGLLFGRIARQSRNAN